MSVLRVQRSGPLRGTLRVPSDLHVGQEALLWAALSDGTCTLRELAPRADHRALASCLRALGVPIAEVDGGVHVRGVGLRGLVLPPGALDVGDSPSTLEIIVALLAGQRFGTRVLARGSAAQHSLRTLLEPLRARGAQLAGTAHDGDWTAPVSVAPLLESEWLTAAEIEIPNGDPATKRALLISGLYAQGATAIQEGMLSRDHSERALLALGVPIETMGPLTLLDTSVVTAQLPAFAWTIPGDFSLAAYVMALALALPGSDVRIENVGKNPSRTAWLDALRYTGAAIELEPKGEAAGGEPVCDVRVRASSVRGARVLGELSLRLMEDVPAFLALCAATTGRLSLRDVAPLRAREGDLLKKSAALLRAFGAECTLYDDGLDVDPAPALAGAKVSADTPLSLKLAALVLGSCATGETLIEGGEQVEAFCPGLLAGLRTLGARIDETR